MNPAPEPRTEPTPAVVNARTLGRLIARFAPAWGRTAVVFLILAVRGALDVVPPLIVAAAIDLLAPRAELGGGLPGDYVRLLWILGGVYVAKQIVFYVSQVAAAALSQDLENSFRSDLFRQVMRLRFTYHDENRSGETIARSLRDMQKVRHFFREVWFGYMEVSLLLAAVLVVVFFTHWSYGLVVSATFGTGIGVCIFVGRRIAHMDREISDTYDNVATVLQENVAGARVVRAFGREQAESGKFGGRMDAFSGGWARLERYWTGVMPAVNHLYHLSLPAILALGVLRVAADEGGLGEVAAVLLYVRTVHHRIRPITRLVVLGQQAVASASRVFEVLDRTDRIEEGGRRVALGPAGGDLRFENVQFGHTAGEPILRGVSLHVPTGGSLGILGATGSGKSSLVHLVPRFYDPDGGRILLGGTDIREVDVGELRAAVGLVFQEAFLFSGTVHDNIAYGNPNVSREQVVTCARLAVADEFVRKLPDGYDTVVGERGVSLSGGQCQRLTIARALAADPRVLIFDDATASVDAVTEKELFEGIRAAARGRTTLVISQRVTSVRWCDRTVVLENGVVTAIGTHEELLRRSDLYREIYSHQQLMRGRP